MSRKYEEPTKTPESGPRGGYVENHPAYAQIIASRVQGGHTVLYGSDFNHNHYVTVSIHRSQMHRGLSRDWHHSREEYIEVALSEAQWASFVSSMNVGSGTPCTLQHHNGQMVPSIPAPPKRHEQFSDDLRETLSLATESLKELSKKIQATNMTAKARAELMKELQCVERNLEPNIDFVSKSFGEHMETVTEHARVEVNAYIQGTLTRAGLAALAKDAVISLDAPD